MDTPEQSKKLPSSIPIPKSKRGPKGFFTEIGREMKKVNWPSFAENNRLTGVVLAICVIAATILTLMSFGFEKILKFISTGSFN